MITEEIFEDMKKNAIKIWSGYDDKFGYATEKINKVKDIKMQDYYIIWSMFDFNNQKELLFNVKNETRNFIKNNLI